MTIALTEDLLAKFDRRIEDTGSAPGIKILDDRDYLAIRARLLAERPPGAVWVFAYGSLLWNPCFDFEEQRRATLHGWHRSMPTRRCRHQSWRSTMHVKADGISPSVLAREEALNILSKVGTGFCCGDANEMLAYLDRLAPLDAAIAPASERPGTWGWLRSTILGGLFRT